MQAGPGRKTLVRAGRVEETEDIHHSLDLGHHTQDTHDTQDTQDTHDTHQGEQQGREASGKGLGLEGREERYRERETGTTVDIQETWDRGGIHQTKVTGGNTQLVKHSAANGEVQCGVEECSLSVSVSPPPPPLTWSDDGDCRIGPGLLDTDTECVQCAGPPSQSSLLVDMGKVVGLLRRYPSNGHPHIASWIDSDSTPNNGTTGEQEHYGSVTDQEVTPHSSLERTGVCVQCLQEESLCGDPLVYATFVAPIQQCSTDTEPSRQQSFKQNSGEIEQLPVTQTQVRQDIYASTPMEGRCSVPSSSIAAAAAAAPDVQEVSTAELNHQAQQERLSFIHSQGSSEDQDYDQVPLPQPPAFPSARPIKLVGWEGHTHQEYTSHVLEANLEHTHSAHSAHAAHTSHTAHSAHSSHTPHNVHSSHNAHSGHIQHSAHSGHQGHSAHSARNSHSGRGAHTTHSAQSANIPQSECPGWEGQGQDSCDGVHTVRRRHTRRHERQRHTHREHSHSPGREIDRAVVIVHHTGCTHSRTHSPDNLSESSISFHENEVAFDLCPVGDRRQGGLGWYHGGGAMQPCVSVAREGHTAPHLNYSNWESCRESWFSSGSEARPSSGSDCTPRPPSLGESLAGGGASGGAGANVTLPTSSTLPRSAVRQSSRDSSGSSSRGGVHTGPRTGRSQSPGARIGEASLPHRNQIAQTSVLGGSHHSLATPKSIHGVVTHSRDSTPSESGCSSGPSAPSASDQEVGCSDLAHQDSATEEALIENLYHRFKRDQIYTWVSTVLVSINSYKKLSLYTPEVIDKYRSHCLRQLPPHIYSIADRAWHYVKDHATDQALLLTGESGAGKTEAGKLVLQYIAAVTGQGGQARDVKYQILQSNPVLEGFGNARTLHNDNSSRFGKYIEVSFDFKGDTTGGSVTNYWLEKTRVTHRLVQERNFHIFYQLLAGADIQLLKELRLQRNVECYRLLQWGGTHTTHTTHTNHQGTRPGHNSSNQQALTDRRDFHITKKALEDLGLSPVDICDIFKVVAAVLKLGNLNFVPVTNMDGTEGCRVDNEYELYEVCELVGLDLDNMRSALLARTLPDSEHSPVSDLCAGEAACGVSSLCRTMYSRLFTLIVARINEAIKVKTPRKQSVLGILDLYGFEAFQQNGFEQFIINFANEKLQQVFVEVMLKREQEEYMEEGVEWTEVGFFSNSGICSLLDSPSSGLLSLLDLSCLPPSSSSSSSTMGSSSVCTGDSTFLAAATTAHCSHPHYETEGSQGAPGSTPVPAHSFRIKHYAGSVTYSVSGFQSSNTDSLSRDLSCVMFQSCHPILRTLFPEGNLKRTMRRRPATVGTQFKISIGALINNLGSKTSHFVRCIKPNENRISRVFDMSLVQHQIRYLGLVEVARLRRNGFAFRSQYCNFLHRFKMLCCHTWPQWHGPAVEGVTYLLRELHISAKEYSFGRSKIFIRCLGVVDQLEEWRRDRLEELATLIQKVWRGWHARQNWMKLRDSQIVISTYWKRWKDKSHITELKQRRKQEWAVVILQKHYRRWQISRWLMSLAHNLPSESPSCRDWPRSPPSLKETSFLLRKLYHGWRCERFRVRFDQTSRNRMREKVTASLIFKDKKSSYPRSVAQPFRGDHIGLRRNPLWKEAIYKTGLHRMDRCVVFGDIVNKINRSNGKFVPILFVISTSSMLILDQRTMQIKYRVPASEIFQLSLSPYYDDIAVFHVSPSSPTRELRSQANIPSCLSSEAVRRKGDFVFQTGHVIEIVTKLFLVVQNATGKPPLVNINTQFDANFGTHSVTFQFKTGGAAGQEVVPGHVKLVKRGNRMEVVV